MTKISVRELNEKDRSRSGSLEVKRDQFDYLSCVARSATVKDNKATIEIISPVLKDSKYRWKGIYNKGGETIDFYMQDEDFKKQMFEDKISFTSGMCIDCVLEIARRLSELGEVVNVSYTVTTVIRTRSIRWRSSPLKASGIFVTGSREEAAYAGFVRLIRLPYSHRSQALQCFYLNTVIFISEHNSIQSRTQ
mgnify:CR=1 FL=1